MCGLTNITKRDAEISLMIDPAVRAKGLGTQALKLLLQKGFEEVEVLYGEVYYCNTALEFWKKVLKGDNVRWSTLPDRKYFSGRWWDSLYFSIMR
jgi:RimJ/RimL family protein N-acetyltransferase